jgi:cobalt/nickel transport system permease protein
VGAGHAHALYVHEHSAIHRLAPEVKVSFAISFSLIVALTPREAVWAFGLFAVIIFALTRVARLRAGFVAVRLVTILPFIAFAFLIPFVAVGDQIAVLGVDVSREGLWAAWNVIAKATLGAAGAITLAATTEVPEIIRGLGRLRVPGVLTAIAGFMIRYLELISEELRRVRIAMTSRGYDPRWLWQARPMASAAGATFVRSYERGERVHAAMLSRGYVAVMPDIHQRTTRRGEWLAAGGVLLVVIAVAVAALVTR